MDKKEIKAIEPLQIECIKQFASTSKTEKKKNKHLSSFSYFFLIGGCLLVFFFAPQIMEGSSEYNLILALMILIVFFRILSSFLEIIERSIISIKDQDDQGEIALFWGLIYESVLNLNIKIIEFNAILTDDKKALFQRYKNLSELKNRLNNSIEYALTMEKKLEDLNYEKRLLALTSQDLNKLDSANAPMKN